MQVHDNLLSSDRVRKNSVVTMAALLSSVIVCECSFQNLPFVRQVLGFWLGFVCVSVCV